MDMVFNAANGLCDHSVLTGNAADVRPKTLSNVGP
jgi:hypothetical protein